MSFNKKLLCHPIPASLDAHMQHERQVRRRGYEYVGRELWAFFSL